MLRVTMPMLRMTEAMLSMMEALLSVTEAMLCMTEAMLCMTEAMLCIKQEYIVTLIVRLFRSSTTRLRHCAYFAIRKSTKHSNETQKAKPRLLPTFPMQHRNRRNDASELRV